MNRGARPQPAKLLQYQAWPLSTGGLRKYALLLGAWGIPTTAPPAKAHPNLPNLVTLQCYIIQISLYILYQLISFRYWAAGLPPELPECSRLEYIIERMIVWILNDCVGFSDVSGISAACRDWPWLRMNGGHKRKPLSNSSDHASKRPNSFRCEHRITESLEIPEWNCSGVFWAQEATASFLSQSGTEESNSLPFHSNSLTHTTILSHTYYYSLSHMLL